MLHKYATKLVKVTQELMQKAQGDKASGKCFAAGIVNFLELDESGLIEF
jgi:hypothetical protein